jgi:hypothetical protein
VVCSTRTRPCVASRVAPAELDLSANAVQTKAAPDFDFMEIEDTIEDRSDCGTLVQVSEEGIGTVGIKDELNFDLLESKLAVQKISDGNKSPEVSDADTQPAALTVENKP